MAPMQQIRPGSLAAAVRSHLEAGSEFRYHLASFLDGFYLDPSSRRRRDRLVDPPGLTGDERFDALVGAIGEHLCRRWRVGPPPLWTEEPERFLKRPWFLGPERMKPFFLVESPSAYRRRFIFTEMEPLRRARMPRDAMWWHTEGIRTGMTPLPEEVVTTEFLDEISDASHTSAM
ncbi:hypothetical protein GGD46_003521 [Rhizobium lusitanum]|uniref:Uncharacterized protein n=1 Tax=Rhizobium lusitanum TaxID=293958 RepID=A0A7X0IV20_9HYPH|nr:hypothetical protein [Rhizobium lusitanum]